MEANTFTFHILYYIEKIWHFLAHKLGLALLFAAWASYSEMLTALGILFIADFICGFLVAYRLRNVSSAAMRRGVAKGMLYMSFITVVTVTEGAISQGEVQFATAVAIGLLLFTEALSVIENLINLGLPMPFAANVLSALASRARILGLNINVDSISKAHYSNDITSMVQVHIPRLRNPSLKRVMAMYYLSWYDFLRNIDSAIVDTRTELAWERIRAAIDEATMSAYEAALREGIDREFVTLFYKKLMKDAMQEFSQRCKRHVRNCDTVPEAVDNVSAALVTMLYQTVNKSGIWDRLLGEGTTIPDHIDTDDLPGTGSGVYDAITDFEEDEELPLSPTPSTFSTDETTRNHVLKPRPEDDNT